MPEANASTPTTVTSSSIGTIVRLADGTTVRLVNPTPQQLALGHSQQYSNPLLQQQQQQQGLAVTWPWLLGGLGLSAAALLAAAASLFMLYVRPILQVSLLHVGPTDRIRNPAARAAEQPPPLCTAGSSSLSVHAVCEAHPAGELQLACGAVQQQYQSMK